MAAEATSTFERWAKWIGVALTLIGLLVGVHQFNTNQSVAAARPFLERKLKWCEEAVETAAGIAIHGRESPLPAAPGGATGSRADRFWALYWGVMGMVENRDITAAMVNFGDGLKTGSAADDRSKALVIAHACRLEMALDWSPAWGRR